MKRYFASIFIIVIIAVCFRLPQITERPLHVDEAVNAFILGTLLDSGSYHYNPGEYHGPTLYYFSLLFTTISAQNTFTRLDEYLIRIIPLVAGCLIAMFTLLIGSHIKPEIGYVAAGAIIVSPVMIYFSRYYIHESLLVAVGLGMVYAGFKSQGAGP